MPEQEQETPEPTPRRGPRSETAALVLLFLVAVDGLATVLMLRTQRGTELNPLMNWLWGHGETIFLLGKMLLTAIAVAWLWRRAQGRERRLVLTVGFAIYAPIVGLHILNNAIVARAISP